jgi:hypothetical protein
MDGRLFWSTRKAFRRAIFPTTQAHQERLFQTSFGPQPLACGLTRWQFEVNSAERREANLNPLIKIAPPRARSRGQCRLKNAPRFSFHGVTVFGGPHAQPFLDRRIEIANGDAAHGVGLARSHDFIIIDHWSEGYW